MLPIDKLSLLLLLVREIGIAVEEGDDARQRRFALGDVLRTCRACND